MGLSRVTELLRLIGDPQDGLKVVHVAGTNGKGSFVAMLSSVLKAAGLKVGSFSSPAITGVTDSIRIDGAEISKEELEKVTAKLCRRSRRMSDKPTEFEVLTAAAYMLFKKHRCDIAVVECGLGGAGDATNVLKAPLLSVITNVQLDHCGRLGNTVAEIAQNKAGIIKPSRPVLYGGQEDTAAEVVARAAEANGSPLYRTELDSVKTVKADLSGTEFTYKGMPYGISLLGAYQPQNAANVLEAVDILRGCGVVIDESAVKTGLKNAEWHGRFELLSKEPCVIFDGSHNPDGVTLAAESIKTYFPDKKAALLMGVMADKDYSGYPELLSPVTQKLFAVRPDNPRALSAETLAGIFMEKGVDAVPFEDFDAGVDAALSYACENGIPLIAMGTLYMYGQFTARFNNLFKNLS